MNEWVQYLPIKDIALKEIMVMPNLLLQKPSKNQNQRINQVLWEKGWSFGSKGNEWS